MRNLREALAAYAHEAWSGWMEYMFSKCSKLELTAADSAMMTPEEREKAEDGGLIIPPELVDRWARQMTTAYADLPEEEKESDRQEADKMLKLMVHFLGRQAMERFFEGSKGYEKGSDSTD